MQGYQNPTQQNEAQRRHWLGRVHIKARQMNLEGDAYRLTLLALSGSKTCESLNADELERLYRELVAVAQQSGKEDNSSKSLQNLLA